VQKEMTSTLWLSVIEICNRACEMHPKLKDIGTMAREKYNQGFNADLLRTDLTKEDHEPSTGRRVKK